MSVISESRKRNIAVLKENDIISLLLYSVYRLEELPEYSTLSQLVYVLDKDSLMKLCATYGGCTIKIPTVAQLKIMVNALLLYQYVDVDGLSFKDAMSKLELVDVDRKELVRIYKRVSDVINEAK